MLAVILQRSCVWIVFPRHELIDKGVASFDDFGDFLNLSFFNLLIEDFFIFSIVSSLTWAFGSLSDVELFVGRWLNDDILWLFGCGHDVDSLLNRLWLDDFTGLVRLDFSIKCIKLRMVKKRRIIAPEQRQHFPKKFSLILEQYKQCKNKPLAIDINNSLNGGVDIFGFEGLRGLLESGELGQYLSESKVVVGFGAVLLFRLSVEGVIGQVDKPVSELDIAVDEQDILRMNLPVNNVTRMQVLDTLHNTRKCINNLLLRKQLPIPRAFPILQLHHHRSLRLGVEQAITIKQWP